MAQNRVKMLFLQGVHACTAWRNSIFCSPKSCKKWYSSRVYLDIEPGRIAFCSAKPCKNRAEKTLPEEGFFYFFFKQPQCLAPAGQSSPVSSATGAGPRGSGSGEGARRVGLRLDTEAGLRGGAAACGAARSAAAGAQREVLRLSGVVHVVGGPDVLHGRVLAALLGPEERVLEDPARALRPAGQRQQSAGQPGRRHPLQDRAEERRGYHYKKTGSDDGHFMALRGPVTLRHMRFRLTDLDGNVVRLRGSSLSFVLYLDHV